LTPFGEYCGRVQTCIEEHYGIRVVTRDVPDPLTGDLDGCEIHIDYAVAPAERLFLLAHLFGHTVQWNVNPLAPHIGKLHQPPVPKDASPGIIEYEREAAAYGLTLLHQTGITNIDSWYSDYAACDMAYLRHFYETGERRDFVSFWCDHSPLIEPHSIPPFHPVRRALRGSGLVI
jgi:hypothetical protein